MSRPKGSKNFNRRLLGEVLTERGIDLIGKAWQIIDDPSTPTEIKARMVMTMLEYVYPKRRPEDANGSPDQSGGTYRVVEEFKDITDEELKTLAIKNKQQGVISGK